MVLRNKLIALKMRKKFQNVEDSFIPEYHSHGTGCSSSGDKINPRIDRSLKNSAGRHYISGKSRVFSLAKSWRLNFQNRFLDYNIERYSVDDQ